MCIFYLSCISITDKYYITQDTIDEIEAVINETEAKLPPIKAFIMPGKTKAGAFLDLVRTTVRRAEREVLSLADEEEINPNIKVYLNRLSDLAFLLMRIEDDL